MFPRPLCIRYTNEWAAFVCSGVWRAKKHREVAAYGRHLWATLTKRLNGRLWLQFSSHKSAGYVPNTTTAAGLAASGRTSGVRVFRRP